MKSYLVLARFPEDSDSRSNFVPDDDGGIDDVGDIAIKLHSFARILSDCNHICQPCLQGHTLLRRDFLRFVHFINKRY